MAGVWTCCFVNDVVYGFSIVLTVWECCRLRSWKINKTKRNWLPHQTGSDLTHANVYTPLLLLLLLLLFILGSSAAQRGLWPPRFMKFLDHTQRRATVIRTPLDKWSARRWDLYLTTHKAHTTKFHAPDWIRNHDRSRRAAVDLCRRPRGHWDRHMLHYLPEYLFTRQSAHL
jgi:hypothetical protein